MDTDIAKKAVEGSLSRIWTHPFIVDALNGKIEWPVVKRWIFCAGRESRIFPSILEGMLSSCDDAVVKGVLQDNLDDELGHGNPEHAHFMHYRQLLGHLNVDAAEFDAYREGAGVKLALDLAKSIAAAGRLSIALGYMLVNEGMTYITYSAVKGALLKVRPAAKTAFFDLHISVDEEHVTQLYRAVSAISEGEKEKAEILYGVQIGERGMAVLLDEVYGAFDNG